MAAKAKNIKLFQFLHQYYSTIGIYSTKSNQKHRYNVKVLFFLFIETQLAISSLTSAFFKAKSLSEFVDQFYLINYALASMGLFLIQMWKIDDILQLIERLEEFITKSE